MSTGRSRMSKLRNACGPVQKAMFDFADGRLDDFKAARVIAHLESCESCRRDFEQVRFADSALSRASESLPDPGDLYPAFRSRLAANQHNPSNRLRFVMLPSVALASVVVCSLVLLRFHTGTSVAQLTGTYPITAPHGYGINNTSTRFRMEAGHIGRAVHDKVPISVSGTPGISPLFAIVLQAPKSAHSAMSRRVIAINTVPRRDMHQATLSIVTEASHDPHQYSPHLGKAGVRSTFGEMRNRSTFADMVLVEPEVAANIARKPAISATVSPLNVRSKQANVRLDRVDLVSESIAGESVPQTAGFALVVQDDVRGFTSEAHGPGESRLQRQAVDNGGVSVAVELDDPTAASKD